MARLTKRQQRSRKASQDKARRMRVHGFWDRVKIRGFQATAAVVVLAGGYLVLSGTAGGWWERSVDKAWFATADAGFAVHAIHLEGRSRTSANQVTEAINVEVGEPILRLSLSDLREQLETIPTVKQASVERGLPDRLLITLAEREPVAIWQYHGKLVMIDDVGTAMPELEVKSYAHMPLVVGKGAPEQVADILNLLAGQPELQQQVRAVTRISQRRWDVHLKQGITIKLPQEAPEVAWKRLAHLHREQQLLLRAISAVDMRSDERMYITVLPDAPDGEKIIKHET